jgi:LemA protein
MVRDAFRLSVRRSVAALLGWLLLLLGGCGYNTLQRGDEEIKASWAEVLNQYQRRADLVPNLVQVVKAEAAFEQGTLVNVVEARARATAIQAGPGLVNDPKAFEAFQRAQGELGGALARLLVVTEAYPTLRANQAFRDLQSQLEGTENRITVARRRYIESVQAYNVTVRSFPSNLTAMAFGYHEKAGFTVTDEAALARPPVVDLSTAPRAAAAASRTP